MKRMMTSLLAASTLTAAVVAAAPLAAEAAGARGPGSRPCSTAGRPGAAARGPCPTATPTTR